MGLDIARIAGNAVAGAGKAVNGLLRPGVLFVATGGGYDPTTGMMTGETSRPVSFQAVRKEYSIKEFTGEGSTLQSFNVQPGDFKLIIPATLVSIVPATGMLALFDGDRYAVQSVSRDAVDAVYTLQMRPGKDVSGQ